MVRIFQHIIAHVFVGNLLNKNFFKTWEPPSI